MKREKPKRMKPVRQWAIVGPTGKCLHLGDDRRLMFSQWSAPAGGRGLCLSPYRIARVTVTEHKPAKRRTSRGE